MHTDYRAHTLFCTLLFSPPSQTAEIPDIDLSKLGVTKFGSFEVEVVDNTADYFKTLKVRCCAVPAALRCAALRMHVVHSVCQKPCRCPAGCVPGLPMRLASALEGACQQRPHPPHLPLPLPR